MILSPKRIPAPYAPETIGLADAERIVRWYLPGGPEYEPIKDGVVRVMREGAISTWRARVVATAFGG